MSRTGGGPVGRRRLGPAVVGTARLSAVLAVLTVLALVTGLPTPGSASGSSASGSSGPAWSAGPSGDGTCQPLSTAQLVAQVIGAPLRSPTADATATTLAAEHAGTVVLLGDAITSAEQVRGLVDTLDASAPAGLPPLIAVDEEGGRVARFGRAGVTVRLPSARQQAAMWSPDELRGRAAELGRQMADLGVDWDLAPVLDLTDAPADTVIGDRSFGTDPSVVGAYGGAFAAGLRDAGLVTNGKHFPDHGLTTVDTHRAVASVEVSREALRQRHLTPYRLADEQLDSIMLSHLRVSSLDPSLPASLSSVAVDFLRDELDWDRALVTDDLSMQAVASVADQPTAALMALQAGVDVLLLGTPDSAAAAHARILSAVDQGALPVERLRQAVRRALALKGIEGAAASCLLGLPPVAEARAAVDGDGAVVAVVDGVRRPVPDAETLARRGATPVRYSDAELVSLPLGDPLVSARRFAVAVVAGEGADPLDVAVQRAEQSAGAQAHARVVAVTTTVPIAAALAADASSGSPVLPVGGGPDRLGGSLDRVVGDGGEVIVVGPVPDGLGRPVVHIDAEDPVAGAMQVWDRRGEPAVETVVVASPEVDPTLLLPWLARADVAVLLTPADRLDPGVAERLAGHGGTVHTLGLADAVDAAVREGNDGDRIPTDPRAQAEWLSDRGVAGPAVLAHDGPDHLLAALPLARDARALPLPAVAGALPGWAEDVAASWRLPGGATVAGWTAGVAPSLLTDLAIPTYWSRRE